VAPIRSDKISDMIVFEGMNRSRCRKYWTWIEAI